MCYALAAALSGGGTRARSSRIASDSIKSMSLYSRAEWKRRGGAFAGYVAARRDVLTRFHSFLCNTLFLKQRHTAFCRFQHCTQTQIEPLPSPHRPPFAACTHTQNAQNFFGLHLLRCIARILSSIFARFALECCSTFSPFLHEEIAAARLLILFISLANGRINSSRIYPPTKPAKVLAKTS